MKTLKRTLVALAALTVASMSMTAVASADEGNSEPTTATTAEATSETTPETSGEAATTEAATTEAATTAAAATTTAAATTAANADHSDPNASTVITISTVTVKPGTKTASVDVTISGNKGFAGTGLGYTYNSKLKLSSVKEGLVAPEEADGANYKALTSAKSKDITGDGVLYTLEFALPDDAKAGDVFEITGSVDVFSNAAGDNVGVKMVAGAIKVEDEKATTAATTVAGTTAASTTKAATKTVKKAGSSPATGEALPIAGAAAAVAVIGGVAVASRKRK